ncbi:YT521-B-like domain-containing protein [Mycena vulgaris]|nr:YT521-B-like domain-containing protein [Mycena vulgaris]
MEGPIALETPDVHWGERQAVTEPSEDSMSDADLTGEDPLVVVPRSGDQPSLVTIGEGEEKGKFSDQHNEDGFAVAPSTNNTSLDTGAATLDPGIRSDHQTDALHPSGWRMTAPHLTAASPLVMDEDSMFLLEEHVQSIPLTEPGALFPVAWHSTARLPFDRTRDIRNGWNHNRAVRQSRDGTELEPSAGEMLLKLWQDSQPVTPLG